jgi:hypothetical protein
MHIPVEPNLDKPIPLLAQPQNGKTYEDRLKIAGNTAMLLRELGIEETLTPEEDAKAKEMIAKLKPAEGKNSEPAPEEKALQNVGVALKIGGYLSEYEKQIVADKIQVRTVVVNRLMEISQDEDNKTALKALEVLGKASDLFTERSEITITHQTSDELKAAIKERIKLLMQTQQLDVKTKAQKHLEVIDADVKEIK